MNTILSFIFDFFGTVVDVSFAIVGIISFATYKLLSTVLHRIFGFVADRFVDNPLFGAKLPPNQFSAAAADNLARAYARCLEFEKTALHHSDAPIPGQPPLLTCARLVGYLLLEAPDQASRENLTDRIMDCPNLKSLAIHFADFYCQYVHAIHFRVRPVVSDDDRSYFDDIKENISEGGSPINFDQAKAAALLRDGGRCSITGLHDVTAYRLIPAVEEEARRNRLFGRSPVVNTDPVYILPPNVLDEDYLEPGERVFPLFRPILEVYGKDIIDELDGRGIHSLENVLTLQGNLSYLFNTFGMWLIETDTPNLYSVCFSDTKSKGPRHVTFSSTDLEKFPLPLPRYLRIHAACARAGMLSGASNYATSLVR